MKEEILMKALENPKLITELEYMSKKKNKKVPFGVYEMIVLKKELFTKYKDAYGSFRWNVDNESQYLVE